jgi:hypothetical protein
MLTTEHLTSAIHLCLVPPRYAVVPLVTARQAGWSVTGVVSRRHTPGCDLVVMGARAQTAMQKSRHFASSLLHAFGRQQLVGKRRRVIALPAQTSARCVHTTAPAHQRAPAAMSTAAINQPALPRTARGGVVHNSTCPRPTRSHLPRFLPRRHH